ncbi:MAG: hypothetical protein DMG70_20090 [Acidobacteria bacterium]|nr:MAG: hypothetical protein DMG70_20090 [Acidobacteriota bacterium]
MFIFHSSTSPRLGRAEGRGCNSILRIGLLGSPQVPPTRCATLGNTAKSPHLKIDADASRKLGTTRETVSRLFYDFKKKELWQLNGFTLILRNKAALEKNGELLTASCACHSAREPPRDPVS